MFDTETLEVGDVFYSVKERNTALVRKKIHQVIDGEDWFKYDRPLRMYEIVTYTVLGIIRKNLEGEWRYDPSGYDLQTEFFVRYQGDTHVGVTEMDFYDDRKYFLGMDEALQHKAELEAQAREMDLT